MGIIIMRFLMQTLHNYIPHVHMIFYNMQILCYSINDGVSDKKLSTWPTEAGEARYNCTGICKRFFIAW